MVQMYPECSGYEYILAGRLYFDTLTWQDMLRLDIQSKLFIIIHPVLLYG